MAGNDVIFGGLGGDGDLIAGDALSSHDVGGDATANNEATTESVGGSLALSLAGNDALVAVSGNDTIAGDALSLGRDATRSEDSRVGKECGSPCSTRWSPYHQQKKKTIQ